jgi:hypothetical protein
MPTNDQSSMSAAAQDCQSKRKVNFAELVGIQAQEADRQTRAPKYIHPGPAFKRRTATTCGGYG